MLQTTLPRLAQIQRPVADRLERVVDELRRIVLTDFTPISDVNEHLLTARGKLLRPTLLLLSNEVRGRRSREAVTVGAVVELIHLATLVHDDAVDHSILRRGMPTVNALWNHQTAIIMGDYLYSRSISELVQFDRIELIGVLSRAANEMSVGEMRQLVSCEALDLGEQGYYRLIASKTASLMSAACEVGALLSDEEDGEHRRAMARYGERLGMAFQIADDLLDYTETEAVTGKPSGHDLREHKVTLPLIAAYEEMGGDARRAIRAFFADPEPTDDGIETVVGLVEEYGGLDYARRRAEEYGEQAAKALVGLPSNDAAAALHDAITYVVDRRR